MDEITCDVAVVGAGTAGLSARSAASAAGATTALIESGPGGTTCARVGCMPSKLLIAAAGAAHGTTNLPAFGLALPGPVRVDGPAVMARVRRLRDEFVGGVHESTDAIPAAERLRGRARFVGPTRLQVGDRTVQARAVVIATGARPAVPAPFRALGDLVLTNETVFEIPDLPDSLAVIGAGPLGLELAQAFRRLGTRVVVLDEGRRVAGIADPRVAEVAGAVLGRALDIVLGATVSAVRHPEGARISWTTAEGGTGETVVSRVLVAAGRPPDLADLDLAAAGLALDGRGVPRFDPATLRCGDSAVYIAGDAAADRPVLHEAAWEGTTAGGNAARHPHPRPAERMPPLAITYTDPAIARIGGGWGALKEENVAVAEVDLSRSGRARVQARAVGIARLYARRADGRFLGAEMIGPEVEHLAHLCAWALGMGASVETMLDLPYYHPTLEESLRTALRRLCGDLNRRPNARPGDLDYGPGD